MIFYIEVYKCTPEIRRPPFNQDTLHGPSHMEKCTKLPLKVRTPPLIRTFSALNGICNRDSSTIIVPHLSVDVLVKLSWFSQN